MKAILTALLLATVNAFAQQPASPPTAKPVLINITATKPQSPATLKLQERFNVEIHYTNPGSNSVTIFARPYTNGQKTDGYSAHPSDRYPKGSGQVEGWFFFAKATSVDEVQVQMIDTVTKEVIATAKLPIQAAWK